MHNIKFPVGDWSNDGHGQCEWVLLDSSVPVDDLREMYFNACSQSGIVFDREICSSYDDNQIEKKQLQKLGITKEEVSFDEEEYEDFGVTTELFMRIFIAWMKKHNPGLELTVIEDNMPIFSRYGFDAKKRHIGHLGYGLFR